MKDLHDSILNPLKVRRLPKSPKVRHRKRKKTDSIDGHDLCHAASKARLLLMEELKGRILGAAPDERPSPGRLVAIWMSKTKSPKKVLPKELHADAEAQYKRMLRTASTKILKQTAQPADRNKTAPVDTSFQALSSGDSDGSSDDTELLTSDPVLHEIKKWKNLPKKILKKYRNAQGWLDEFAMMSDLKSDFPLHYVVFRQTACHMAHEANVECVFSLAKRVSHPCSKSRTVTELTMMATKNKNGKPTWREVWAR